MDLADTMIAIGGPAGISWMDVALDHFPDLLSGFFDPDTRMTNVEMQSGPQPFSKNRLPKPKGFQRKLDPKIPKQLDKAFGEKELFASEKQAIGLSAGTGSWYIRNRRKKRSIAGGVNV